MMLALMPADRELYRFGDQKCFERTKRIVELEKLFARLPDSELGRRYASYMLDHYAWLVDGRSRMDRFLEIATAWMSLDEREQLIKAALGSCRFYDAIEMGELVDLTFARRSQERITTMRAIDTPADLVVGRKAAKATYMRDTRAAAKAQLQPPPDGQRKAGKRKKEELHKRRVAAIYDAVGLGGEGTAVRDICTILARKHRKGPFIDVAVENLPRAVRDVLGTYPVELDFDIPGIKGRPDLRAQMLVTRLPVPTNEREYLARAEIWLGSAVGWKAALLHERFYSPEETALRARCGASKHERFGRIIGELAERFAGKRA